MSTNDQAVLNLREAHLRGNAVGWHHATRRSRTPRSRCHSNILTSWMPILLTLLLLQERFDFSQAWLVPYRVGQDHSKSARYSFARPRLASQVSKIRQTPSQPPLPISTTSKSQSSSTQLQLLPRAVTAPVLSLSMLGLVVLVHELGHYLAARMFDMSVLEFSLGMGPKLFSANKWGNQFSVRAIPIGGYVSFDSELEHEDLSLWDTLTPLQQSQTNSTPEEWNASQYQTKGIDPSNWLNHRPCWQRAVVISAGVMANFMLSYGLYLGIVRQLYPQTPVWKLIKGTAMYMFANIKLLATEMTKLLFGALQSAIGAIESFWVGIFRAIFPFLFQSSVAASSLVAEPPRTLNRIGGPVHVIKTGSDVAYHQGFPNLLSFGAHLSLNLGVVNALPLPVLDGGRLLFVVYEAVTGRKVPPRVEETLNTLTTLLLLWLFFSTSWSDVSLLMAGRGK